MCRCVCVCFALLQLTQILYIVCARDISRRNGRTWTNFHEWFYLYKITKPVAKKSNILHRCSSSAQRMNAHKVTEIEILSLDFVLLLYYLLELDAIFRCFASFLLWYLICCHRNRCIEIEIVKLFSLCKSDYVWCGVLFSSFSLRISIILWLVWTVKKADTEQTPWAVWEKHQKRPILWYSFGYRDWCKYYLCLFDLCDT